MDNYINTRSRRRPGGGGDLAAIAVALLLFGRVVGPLLRSIGPFARQPVFILLAAAVPVALIVRLRSKRREAREIAEARAARARARANRQVREERDRDADGSSESGQEAERMNRPSAGRGDYQGRPTAR